MSLMTSPALRYAKSLGSYNPIPRSCALYLPLWSPSLNGPYFKSADPYGHTCTVTGTTLGATGRTFDGNDDVIDCGDHAAFKGSSITAVVWAKPNAGVSDEGFITKKTSQAAQKGFTILVASDKLTFNVGVTGDFVQPAGWAPPDINTWFHLVFTFNRPDEILYVDTTSRVTFSYDRALGTDTTTLKVGRAGWGDDYLAGIIGEARVYYNYAFSPSEVTYDYNLTKWRYV